MSAGISAAAGPATMVRVSRQPPSSALDREVWTPGSQPVVVVRDAAGVGVAGAVVTASVATGPGTLQGTLTATTKANGSATFGDLGLAGAGTSTLRFTTGSLSATSSTVAVGALPSEATTGKWDAPVPWAIVPLHMTLLPTGKILAWGKFEAGTQRMANPRLWNPAAGPPTTAVTVRADTMLFCAGQTLMADGRVMVSGGHKEDDRGLDVTNIFDPVTETWASGLPKMALGRWYPTVTTMADGRVVTVAGRDANSNEVLVPEIWENNRWVRLPGASLKYPYYPRQFLAPNGKLFYAGERVRSRWLDVDISTTNGRGKWTSSASLDHVWKFNRDYGSAAMYDTGKILYVGGGGDPNWSTTDPKASAPTATAETIDLNVTGPRWSSTDPMHFARRHLNATILPDGHVLVTGGTTAGGFNTISGAVHAAEDWNPATGQLDGARQQHHRSRLPFGLAAHAGRHRAPRRERRRQHSAHARSVSAAGEPRDLPPAVPVQGRAADDHEPVAGDGRLRPDVHGEHRVRGPDHPGALDPARLGHACVRRRPARQHALVHPRIGAGQGHHAVHQPPRAAGLLPAVPAQPERRAVPGDVRQGAVDPRRRAAAGSVPPSLALSVPAGAE